jgi:hypothetical protein
MRKNPNDIIDDLRRLERVCLEWAETSTLDLARDAYRSLASNYRDAAAALERESGNTFIHTLPARTLAMISGICRRSFIFLVSALGLEPKTP